MMSRVLPDDDEDNGGSDQPRLSRTRWWVVGGLLLAAVGAAFWYIVIPTQALTRNPAEVQRLAQEIQPMLVPPPFTPEAGYDLQVRYRQRPLLAWAVFKDAAAADCLVIGEIYAPDLLDSPLKLQAAIERSMANQGLVPPRMVDRQPSGGFDVSLGPYKYLHVLSGRDPTTNRQRLCAFAQKMSTPGRIAEILLYVDAQRYPVPRIRQILESALTGVSGSG